MVGHPATPYADVNEILSLLETEVKNVLREKFVGMYLFGSLSSGDFEHSASDIDFLVVTDDLLPNEMIADLEAMHHRIWDTGLKWAEKLEGSYIPKNNLRRYADTETAYPSVNEQRFYVEPHSSDWIIQRYVVREHGVVLAGPDPKTMIDPVGPDDIRRAVTGIFQEWWFPMLKDPSWLQNHGSEYHSYAILTMCRALHALKHGTIVSKPIAATWAQHELGGKWPEIIEQSLAVRLGSREFDLYDDALEIIRITMDRMKNEST